MIGGYPTWRNGIEIVDVQAPGNTLMQPHNWQEYHPCICQVGNKTCYHLSNQSHATSLRQCSLARELSWLNKYRIVLLTISITLYMSLDKSLSHTHPLLLIRHFQSWLSAILKGLPFDVRPRIPKRPWNYLAAVWKPFCNHWETVIQPLCDRLVAVLPS